MPKNIGKPEEDRTFGLVGGLSLISATYSSSESSEDECEVVQTILNNGCKESSSIKPKEAVTPEGELLYFNPASIQIQSVPTDFGDVKVKQEPLDDVKNQGPCISQHNSDSDMLCLENIKEPGLFVSKIKSFTNTGCDTYRNEEVVGTSDSESDSTATVEHESSDSNDSNAELSDTEVSAKESNKKSKQRKAEFSINDLPPIEDLHISVPHEKCKLIGIIKSVVDPLVVVESVPNVPVLNLESVLFLDEGDRALGHIFDVIGNVKEPYYCVRFNSKEHIEKNGVHPGMKVYCAPETDYTAYVFVAQLRQMKGSDASWKDDFEAPPEEQEFSDDETERFAKNGGRKRRTKQRNATAADGIPTEGIHHGNEAYSNGNAPGGRGFKRSQGYRHPSSQPQNFDGYYHHGPPRSPFVPSYVAGFTPTHATRPPFHRYNHPKAYYPNRPSMNCPMPEQPHDQRDSSFNGYEFSANNGTPQRTPYSAPYQEYNMWTRPSPQQNYWQNGSNNRSNMPRLPPSPYINGSASFHSATNHEATSNFSQPPPPGV